MRTSLLRSIAVVGATSLLTVGTLFAAERIDSHERGATVSDRIVADRADIDPGFTGNAAPQHDAAPGQPTTGDAPSTLNGIGVNDPSGIIAHHDPANRDGDDTASTGGWDEENWGEDDYEDGYDDEFDDSFDSDDDDFDDAYDNEDDE